MSAGRPGGGTSGKDIGMNRTKMGTILKRFIVIAAALAIVGLSVAASRQAEWVIDNPYASVDWKKHKQHKGNFHTHTTMSDGRGTPQDVIDQYHKLGYTILSLTDHDTMKKDDPERHKTTWPWSKFGRDPKKLGMVAIEGNELSRRHHIGSYFNDFGDANLKSEETGFEETGKRKGLAVLFHPGRYKNPVEWYVKMYRAYPHLIGLEIFNQGNKYPGDRKTWDAILTAIVAERPVWGFSNDDMHNPASHLGRNWNVMILPALTSDAVRKAMENGTFFFVYSPNGHDNPKVPTVASITVDPKSGSIEIGVTGHETVEWISDGRVVHSGVQIKLNDLKEPGGYVRAEIRSEDKTVMGTQPLRIRSSGK